MDKNYIILTAGGSGSRMNSDIPKQFIPVVEKPLLMWAMEAFYNWNPDLEIIVVIPSKHISLWKDLCQEFNLKIDHEIVEGGETRFESVKNAVALIEGNGLTGVHDGVRPFPAIETIEKVYKQADKDDAAIPCIDTFDSLRKVVDNKSMIINREDIKRVQTPQVFRTSLLKKAYRQKDNKHFTDDASVVEALGHKIHLVEGNEENIKITTKMDLRIAISLAKLYKS